MNPNDYWFPWYPALYADDAVHLTLEQDAIYRRMIDRYMQRREPLPSHSQAVANICMISLDKWIEHSAVILKFFTEKDGLLHHKKCDIELDRQDSYSRRMSENAKKSAAKRKKNQHDASGGLTAAAIQEKTRQDKTGYFFEGRIIKLRKSDFERWQKSYPNISDLRAELQRLDDGTAATRWGDKWFMACSSTLAKINSERTKGSRQPFHPSASTI